MALAASHHATLEELAMLTSLNQWTITIAILNNHKGREQGAYHALIKPFLPDEDTEPSKWSEVEKLAYYRTHHRRRPNRP